MSQTNTAAAAASAEPETDGRRHILLVDDAVTIRAYMQRLLGDAGYRITTAMNGGEGLERALLDPPDLIISDLNMPQMNGLEMIRRLREDPTARQVPIAMLTTEHDEHDLAQAVAAGANYFMVKPPQPEEVLEAAYLLSGRGGTEE